MAGADDAAAEEQDGVEIDHARGRLPRDHVQLVEHHRHHHRHEQLEEPLDPEMDDPEPPRVRHREVARGVEEERRQIEERDRESREQEQRGDLALGAGRGAPSRRRGPAGSSRGCSPITSRICHARPISRYSQPWLPNQNHILPRSCSQPERLAQQAARDHHRQRDKQEMDARDLPARLLLAQRRGEEQPAPDVTGRDPEDGQLKMPRPQQAARQERRQIEPVEALRLDAEVRQRAARQRLAEEKQRGDGEILQRRPLRRLAPPGRKFRMDVRLAAGPAQVIEPAEREQHRRGPGQQCDQAQRAPEDGVGRRPVADRRLIGKIVRVGIGLARNPRRHGPCGPGEERGELAEFLRVRDRPGGQTAAGPRAGEVIAPSPDLPAVRSRFQRR